MSRILVVDDEADIRFLARMMLEDDGHAVVEAADGEAAVAVLSDHAVFDVVLLDLRLPGMSGWDVLTWLRSSASPVPPSVIMFSAQIGPAERERAERDGAVGYLTKPFTEEELLGAVAIAASD